MAKKIKLYPAPHVELRVHVSDEMVRDMNACEERRKNGDDDIEVDDCYTCSWYDICFETTGMCDLPEVRRQVMEMEESHGKIDA